MDETNGSEQQETEELNEKNFSSDTVFYGVAEEIVNLSQRLKDEGISLTKIINFTQQRPGKPFIERVLPPETHNPSEPFVHEPLADAKTIRLLLLHKGSDSDPLEGSIRHESLCPVIGYDPISYAWGDDCMPCSMLLNGRHMPLTRSLYNALRRMRRQDRDRTVWADGVCINQADDAEKSVQVALMPQIFDQTRVWAYLGEEADGSDVLPDLLEKLSEVDYYNFSEQSIMTNEFPPPNNRKWKALFDFLNRPWFKRLWVVQEVVVAKDVRFLCGGWELGWRTMQHMAEVVSKINTQRLVEDVTTSQARAIDEAAFCLGIMLGLRIGRSLTARRLEDLRRRIHGKTNYYDDLTITCAPQRDCIVEACIEAPELFQEVERMTMAIPSALLPTGTPILKLLFMLMHSISARPQDRLYAMVGLAGDITLKDFPPSYSETIEETNLRLSKVLIQKGQGIDVLYHATRLTGDLPLSPSWAADWITPRTSDNHWLKLGWAYRSGGGFERRIDSSSLVTLIDDNTLKVVGFRLDSCSDLVIDFPTLDNKDLTTDLYKIVTFMQRSNMVFSGDGYFTGEAWFDVWIRTLTTDLEAFDPELFSDFIRVLCEAQLRYDPCDLLLTMKRSRSETTVKWLRSVRSQMRGYSVCKTSRGYVGVVPNRTLKEDQIFMLEASHMPFVLRPILDRPGYFSFVGGCYMHGLMNGKAWELEHASAEVFLV